MSELVNVLKRINNKINSSAYSYVYYNELSGEINRITNILEISNDPTLKVFHDEVKDIIKGRYKYNEYLVTYDNVQKTNVLRRKDFKSNLTEVRDRLYQIPQIYNDYYHMPIYKGIHVDVWYKELEHLSGQHVWFNNKVYRAKENLVSNIEFDVLNYEEILDNVILYKDENINLSFSVIDTIGQSFLSFNKLYQYVRGIDIDDLIIEQNIHNECWQITTSFELQENINLRNSVDIKNTSLSIFVTEPNDPNILYRYFNISVNDLLDNHRISIPFKYDWESTDRQVSMYTNKFFDTYVYRVIK